VIRMDHRQSNHISDFCGKKVTASEFELVLEVVNSCGFTRTELARTVCELLGWKRANKKLKDQECVYWLEELERLGLLRLPIIKQVRSPASRSQVDLTARSESQPILTGSVKNISPVHLRQVATPTDLAHWKELVARHHYLGFRVPFGASLRYFIEITTTTGPQIAGCLQFSSPAWRVEARDQWIGWKDRSRKKHLQQIVSNSRFLILPWVQVKGLASHVLSLVTRHLPDDWFECYKIRPVLLETFVEKDRFAGTCYRAANWVCLGETRGRGRMDRKKECLEPVRSVWIYPLDKHCREILCGRVSK
jgi:hypothetical protein